MAGLLDFLSDKIGLLNRVGPLGSVTPSNLLNTGLLQAIGRLNDTAQGASRGMSADLLGGPVDMTAQLMTVPRYLGANTPDFTQSPVGGSQWIGRQMEGLGLLRPQRNNVDETAGRVLGGLLATPQVVAAVGSGAERGLLQAARNATVPGVSATGMGRQMGAIKPSGDALWLHRGGNRWESSFFVNRRSNANNVFEADPFSAHVEPIDSKVLPFAKELESAIGSKPRHFTFENIHTAHGKENNAFGITGTGHAKEVISKAANAFYSFLKNNQIVDNVIYTSAEPSRTKLYERLTKNSSQYLPGFTGIKFNLPGKNETFFSVVRDSQLDNVTELFRAKGIEFTQYSK